jgi:hypothetical protein
MCPDVVDDQSLIDMVLGHGDHILLGSRTSHGAPHAGFDDLTISFLLGIHRVADGRAGECAHARANCRARTGVTRRTANQRANSGAGRTTHYGARAGICGAARKCQTGQKESAESIANEITHWNAPSGSRAPIVQRDIYQRFCDFQNRANLRKLPNLRSQFASARRDQPSWAAPQKPVRLDFLTVVSADRYNRHNNPKKRTEKQEISERKWRRLAAFLPAIRSLRTGESLQAGCCEGYRFSEKK